MQYVINMCLHVHMHNTKFVCVLVLSIPIPPLHQSQQKLNILKHFVLWYYIKFQIFKKAKSLVTCSDK